MILLRSVSSTDGAVVAGQLKLRKLIWSPTAAATFTLKDGGGNTILVLTPAAAGVVSLDFGDEGLYFSATGANAGHQVTTLTGGGAVQFFG
jgi:hypothetical protein